MIESLGPVSETHHSRRRKRLADAIGDGVAFLFSNPHHPSTRDQLLPYRLNSDLYYFTGLVEPESALIIRGAGGRAQTLLFVRDRDATREQWEGKRLGVRRAKTHFKVDEVHEFSKLGSMLRDIVAGHSTIYCSPGVRPEWDRRLLELLQASAGPTINFPYRLIDLRVITGEMRWIKESTEIQLLRRAGSITAQAYKDFLPRLKEMKTELHAARELEASFVKFGGDGLAYDSIVAAGKNGTCLHHPPGQSPIRRKETVLIDAAATFGHYCSDITRTVPVGAPFSPAQAAVYDVVLAANKAVIKRSRPRVTLDELHRLSVQEIAKGLVAAKIVKGPASAQILSGKYTRYYMHRVGHWLGLDVHDTAPTISNKNGLSLSAQFRPLEPGCVFTVEPGVYFDANDESVAKEFRGIGVRIEDNVLITPQGREVLTAELTNERLEIERLC